MARSRRKRRGYGEKSWQRGQRVVLYLRVSDTRGREDTLLSPELQERTDREWCSREGLIVVDVVDDLDKSGREVAKRKIGSVIERIAAGEADGVVVLKVDRFGRNLLDSLLNIRSLEEAGGFIGSATENLADIESSMGKFSLNQMLSIAELQSDQIGEGWVRVHDYRRDSGLPHDGRPRFGYVKNKAGEGETPLPPPKVYTPDELTGPWLRKCFQEYMAGKSIHALVKALNAAGIKTTGGRVWSSNSLRGVLDSGFGAGLIVDRRDSTMQARRPDKVDFVAGAHEAVIDSATWQAYVAKRAEAGAPRNKAPVHKYSRLTFCDSCGRRLVAHTRSSGRRFWCDNGAASQRTTEPCAAPVSIEEYKLDKVVLSWLRDHASGKNAFQDALDRASKAQRVKVDLEGIDADIERQKRRLARLTDILLDADEDDEDARETFRERQGEIRSELKRLRAQRDALAAEANTVEAPSAEAIEALLRVWDKGDVQMVNEALRAVIAEIHIVRAERGKWDEPTARVKITPVWGI